MAACTTTTTATSSSPPLPTSSHSPGGAEDARITGGPFTDAAGIGREQERYLSLAFGELLLGEDNSQELHPITTHARRELEQTKVSQPASSYSEEALYEASGRALWRLACYNRVTDYRHLSETGKARDRILAARALYRQQTAPPPASGGVKESLIDACTRFLAAHKGYREVPPGGGGVVVAPLDAKQELVEAVYEAEQLIH